MNLNPEELLKFSLDCAYQSEKVIIPYYRKCEVRTKSDGSEVTDADQAAEEKIRELLSREYPDHLILGEEYGEKSQTESQYKWVIDPIDGTKPFTLGIPVFATLIALLEDDLPVLGVMHFPLMNETIYAAKDYGCWLRNADNKPVRLKISSSNDLSGSAVAASGLHGTSLRHNSKYKNYNVLDVVREAGKFMFIEGCVQHALLMKNLIHGAIDTIMQPWDSAAIIPCVEEAGGIATTIEGSKEDVVFGGSLLTSCDANLHSELVGILNNE